MKIVPKQATAIQVGHFVICADGRIGMVSELWPCRKDDSALVQFGPTGPVRYEDWRTLRIATGQEIIDAGLAGVGCKNEVEIRVPKKKKAARHAA